MQKIILASASPRRKELLLQMGLEFEIFPSNIPEVADYNMKPFDIAKSLAYGKAVNVHELCAGVNMDAVVIGADTIVAVNGRILGKPVDEADSFNMLSELSDKWHEVITGVSVIGKSVEFSITEAEVTRVKFHKLSKDIILNYIKTQEPEDKAGGYGIQGLGALLVEKIEGCYFNVVGLPIARLSRILGKFNIRIL